MGGSQLNNFTATFPFSLSSYQGLFLTGNRVIFTKTFTVTHPTLLITLVSKPSCTSKLPEKLAKNEEYLAYSN